MTERRTTTKSNTLPGAARSWASLTSPELAALAGPEAVAILPTAAVEQHGPHLPLSTDVDIGEGVLRSALDLLAPAPPLLLLPTVAPAVSSEHTTLAGTLSLDPGTVEGSLVDLGASVARSGIRRLVIFNSHGGNRATIDTAALRLRRRFGLLVVKVHTFRFAIPSDIHLPKRELRHGLHGGAVETAIMLHLHPDRVRTSEVRDFPSLGIDLEANGSRIAPEGSASFAWRADDLHPSGATGDATLATADMGARLVTAWGTELAAILEDSRSFPLDRLGGDGDVNRDDDDRTAYDSGHGAKDPEHGVKDREHDTKDGEHREHETGGPKR